jgi:hypothetical protein
MVIADFTDRMLHREGREDHEAGKKILTTHPNFVSFVFVEGFRPARKISNW